MAKTPIDKLTDNIAKILDDYEEGVLVTLDDVTKKMGQKGALAIKQSARQAFKGNSYYKSWKSETERTTNGSKAVIHSTKPGLPHLLENGHATRNGTGWVSGKEHIKPVEDTLVEEYQTTLKKAIEVTK